MVSVLEPIVDFDECLKDSPKFRLLLEQNETDVDNLEIKLDKLVKLCSSMVDIGKQFIRAKSNFINGIWDLLLYFKDDKTLVDSINRIVQTLSELLKYDNILIDQANRTVSKNIASFIKEDVHKVKESKRHFDRISDELDNVLIRHSQIPKNKVNEGEEMHNILTATRSCFQHTALDYTSQMSLLQSRKRHEVLDSLLSLMHAYGTYFHQGSDLFQDFDYFKKKTATNIVKMREETNTLEKKLEGRHNLVKQEDIVPTLIKSDHVKIEGYLFKRTTNAFKTWNRRWFIIQDHQLVYQKRTNEREVTVMEEDLRLCTARPVVDIDRRYCFEVISPSKSHMLQADSEQACQQWLAAMQAGTDAAYNDSGNEIEGLSVDSQESWCTASSTATSKSSSSSINALGTSSNSNPPTKPPRAAHSQILAVPGNELCCDCGSHEPKWASINLGITLCIECSGIHRSFGVHMSKVRSLMLDAWDPELIKVMLALGNNIVNKIYQANVNQDIATKATPTCSRTIREVWIRAKYVDKAFVDKIHDPNSSSLIQSSPCQSNNNNSLILSNEAELGNKKSELESKKSELENKKSESDIAKNRDNNIKVKKVHSKENCEESTDESSCNDICDNFYNELLYKGATDCDLSVMCEALAKGAQINWNNEKDDKKTPLHQAIANDSVIGCEFLLLNGAKCNVFDIFGKTPLHLATELGNTGQVCLLLKRGADQSLLDVNGNDALTIAVNNANADIVTLLRLAKLNEEMKKDECGNPNDETFNEVVRDFAHLASHSPEKLRRQTSALLQNEEETV